MSLPSDRALAVGKAFREGHVEVFNDVSCNADEVRFGFLTARHTIMRRDADGLIWVRFPEIEFGSRITLRMVMNGLISGLHLSRRYRFSLTHSNTVLTFWYRVTVKEQWTHRRTAWNEWLPIADGTLSALLARDIMRQPDRERADHAARAFTTTVVSASPPPATSASEYHEGPTE